MKVRLSEEGMSRPGWVVFWLIVLTGGWIAWNVLPFYYYYWELEGLMAAQAQKGQEFTDSQIRDTLLKEIDKLEIPIADKSDLEISRFDGKIVIDLKYTEELYVSWKNKDYVLYEFNFAPHVEEDY